MLPELRNTTIVYCKKKLSNTARCSNIATQQVTLGFLNKDGEYRFEISHRCDTHKHTGTVNGKVTDIVSIDQSNNLKKINNFLDSIIGKTIRSKVHTAKQLIVKYRKSNGGIMCLQPITKKWKYVYYNQIEEILN